MLAQLLEIEEPNSPPFRLDRSRRTGISYGTLVLLVFAAAELLLSPDALGSGLGHAVGTGDYATLARSTASLATVGGALGAGLEADDAVREAAYASSGGVGGEGEDGLAPRDR